VLVVTERNLAAVLIVGIAIWTLWARSRTRDMALR
jgi:hypothetical protein